MSYRMVSKKYNIDHKTVRNWVIRSGNKIRTKEEAFKLESKRTKGQRRSPKSEFKKGRITWNKNTKGIMKVNKGSFKKGEHQSSNTEFKKGKYHPSYIDGRSHEKYPQEFNNKLRKQIRERDKFICQNCTMVEKEHVAIYGRVLEIHHINYNRKNCYADNLITLCKQCNMWANKNREYWKEYYKNKMKHKLI